MANDIDDMLGTAAPKKLEQKRGYRESRGPLHDLLTAGLPDFVRENERVADLKLVADALQMTLQGVYKWMRPGQPNRISSRAAGEIIEISQQQCKGYRDQQPITHEQIWPYIN